jgi:hypothetical protein
MRPKRNVKFVTIEIRESVYNLCASTQPYIEPQDLRENLERVFTLFNCVSIYFFLVVRFGKVKLGSEFDSLT